MIYHFKAFHKRMSCSTCRDNLVLKLLNCIINKLNKFSYQHFFYFKALMDLYWTPCQVK